MSKTLSAVCGLFCKACTVYVATQENPAELKRIADRFGVTPDEMACDGCRSERRGPVCRSCEFIACAKKNGCEFCADCHQFPCAALVAFSRKMPHRVDMLQDSARIREAGVATWWREKEIEFSCEGCGIISPWYDLTCRQCGLQPANPFVRAHENEIQTYLAKIKGTEG